MCFFFLFGCVFSSDWFFFYIYLAALFLVHVQAVPSREMVCCLLLCSLRPPLTGSCLGPLGELCGEGEEEGHAKHTAAPYEPMFQGQAAAFFPSCKSNK